MDGGAVQGKVGHLGAEAEHVQVGGKGGGGDAVAAAARPSLPLCHEVPHVSPLVPHCLLPFLAWPGSSASDPSVHAYGQEDVPEADEEEDEAAEAGAQSPGGLGGQTPEEEVEEWKHPWAHYGLLGTSMSL